MVGKSSASRVYQKQSRMSVYQNHVCVSENDDVGDVVVLVYDFIQGSIKIITQISGAIPGGIEKGVQARKGETVAKV